MSSNTNTDGHMATKATAKVIAVNGDILTIEATANDVRLIKNEVVYVAPGRRENEDIDERLMSEVLRVNGKTADIQVFEDTKGVGVGDMVYQSGELLSVELGPGCLSQIFDGLQNPLERLAQIHGTFLKRGVQIDALDRSKEWSFVAAARVGDRLRAGETLGTVQEGRFTHKIMVPFNQRGIVTVETIKEGTFPVDTVIAQVRDEQGKTHKLNMIQRWPVKKSIAETLARNGKTKRHFPSEPLITQQRLIDTFLPIARGGTACIPGPFGAGKTVLQHTLSKYAAVDIVIVIACGERAGEVVETITEFPHLQDPTGTGTLMDRTTIICNTSSMPVAAREASIYTGMTLGEYYRQMGYNVLLLADSTSRWAQAMRETSNRLEEIPGEEGFPAYIDSAIKGLYERAGVISNEAGESGSMTMIGTVSPAGGNFEEPVTQSTLATVKCFLGLSYDRAYKRFFPAVDPLISWSRYLDQLAPWYRVNISEHWVEQVKEMQELIVTGEGINQMMQVTGEEGVTLADYVTYQKALFLDMVFLQQDAFDKIDSACPMVRQQFSFNLIFDIARSKLRFAGKKEARDFFVKLTGLFKNLNYAHYESSEYKEYVAKIEELREQFAMAQAA